MPSKSTEQVEQSLLDQVKLVDEQDEHAENWKNSRPRLVQTGQLEVGGGKFACFIIDLSKKGTKFRTLEPLEVELSSVRLHISEIEIFDAEVCWVEGGEIGLLLHQEVEAPEDHETANI